MPVYILWYSNDTEMANPTPNGNVKAHSQWTRNSFTNIDIDYTMLVYQEIENWTKINGRKDFHVGFLEKNVFCILRDFPVTDEFPSQRPVTRSFDVFFDLHLNNGWVNNRDAGDLRRHCAHYDTTVMIQMLVNNDVKQCMLYRPLEFRVVPSWS